MFKGRGKSSEIRCERGADIARMLGLPEATARRSMISTNIGTARKPTRAAGRGDLASWPRSVALLQTIEVFFTAYGLEAGYDVAVNRRGQWFDPHLVDALAALGAIRLSGIGC